MRKGRDTSDQSVWQHYVERSAGGDQGAFASLYDASRRLVYATALRIVGEPADAMEPGPGHNTEADHRRYQVAAALDTLPPEQREVLELAFFSGLTHTELAARLNQPLGTVKTRVRQGMMKIRELLVEFK